MCLKCVEPYRFLDEGEREHSWDRFCKLWNEKLTACRNYPLIREKPIPTNTYICEDRYFGWEMFLNKSIYPSFHSVEIGIGIPSPSSGRALQNKSHFICQDRLVTYHREKQHSIGALRYLEDSDEIECCFQIGYWTGIGDLEISCRGFKTIAQYRNIDKELFPIAVVGTEFGDINLVRTNEPLSLETQAALEIVRQTNDIKDLDEMTVPPSSHDLLKRLWIRCHAVVLTGPAKCLNNMIH